MGLLMTTVAASREVVFLLFLRCSWERVSFFLSLIHTGGSTAFNFQRKKGWGGEAAIEFVRWPDAAATDKERLLRRRDMRRPADGRFSAIP